MSNNIINAEIALFEGLGVATITFSRAARNMHISTNEMQLLLFFSTQHECSSTVSAIRVLFNSNAVLDSLSGSENFTKISPGTFQISEQGHATIKKFKRAYKKELKYLQSEIERLKQQ